MADFKIFLKMSGTEPTEWFESIVTDDEGMSRPPQKKSGTGATGFMATLATKVKELFEQTLKDASNKKYSGVAVTLSPAAADVGQTDLLCYVCSSRSNSVLSAKEPEIAKQAPKSTGGVTAPITGGKLGNGMLSEIYIEEYRRNITCVSFGIYHEFMHNKKRATESIDWPHVSGGGGVASEEGPLSLYRPNKTNKVQMSARLDVANAQYKAGL